MKKNKMQWVPKTPAQDPKEKKQEAQPFPASSPHVQSKSKPQSQRHLPAKKAPTLEDLLTNAVFDDKADEIKSLISQGADPNARCGVMGDTALHHAVSSNKKQAVRALLEMKAQVNMNASVSSGIPLFFSRGTPLHMAVSAPVADIEMVELLLNARANVNLCDAVGDTPLHQAVYASIDGSHKAVVELLLKAGADVSAKNKKGLTPIALAVEQQEPEIAALLVQWQKKKPEDPLRAQYQKR